MALVVGGSGMLGRVLMAKLKCPGTHFKHPRHNTIPWDPAILKDYSVIINCVCDKNVDRCERNFADAKRINADFVDELVKANPFAHLIQISTEYVYGDGRVVDPKNVYGVTKLLGEFKAQRADKWTVLRLPILYDDPIDTVCTTLTWPCIETSLTPRYHTSCHDVAEVIQQIITRKLYGVLNFSASTARSKHDIIECLNLPVSSQPMTRGAPRSGHVYIGNDFNILPHELDLSPFVIPTRDMFMVLDLDGTLLDTVELHKTCYERANWKRDVKTKLIKQHTMFDFKWNSDTLIDFIVKHNINHVVLTNTTMDVVNHFRKCVPKLNLLKNFVTKDSYSCRKPDPEPYDMAMKYHRGEKNIMVFDDMAHNLAPMKRYTRLLFHMSNDINDRSVFTLNDFARLVYAMGG